jgi:tetratricopeptide (TPR) repeat protein
VALLSQTESSIVENVVAALTGAHANPRVEFKLLVERAAKEIDLEEAKGHAAQVIAHLTEHCDDAAALEALIVLGLAHPGILEQHRVSMPQEGRRLAVLLEKAGEADRAQTVLELLASSHPGDRAIDHELNGVMRRSGNLARLVERHLSRAEQALREGRRSEAQRWLREVIALDPGRRDVARMIRDLRFEEQQRRQAFRRRLRTVALVGVLAAAAYGVIWREQYVDQQYAAIPAADGTDLPGMRERLAALDGVIESNPLWLGMWSAGRERSKLRTDIDRLEARRAEAERKVNEDRARQQSLAESERTRARMLAEQYQFSQALEHFRLALSSAPEDWQHRMEVQRDVDAILQWQRENPVALQGEHK